MVKNIPPSLLVFGGLGVAAMYLFSRAFNRVDKVVNQVTKPIAAAIVDLTHDGVTFTRAGFVFYHEDFNSSWQLKNKYQRQALEGAHPEHKKMLAELFDYGGRLKQKYRHLVGSVIITPSVLWGDNG